MLKAKVIKRSWGKEEIIADSECLVKRLVISRGYRTPLQYHKKGRKTFYLYRGCAMVERDSKKERMEYEDIVEIPKNTMYRFNAIKDSEIIEFSIKKSIGDTYVQEPAGKTKLRVAYDYDGVISHGIKSQIGAPIITGRCWEEGDRILEKWLRLNHPIYYNPVTLNEKTTESEMEWKAKMINKLKIEEYYEDIPKFIEYLKVKCPHCNIIKV
jgi:mannose-6-phosphate isomerase-like protein (cupin superfamily)